MADVSNELRDDHGRWTSGGDSSSSSSSESDKNKEADHSSESDKNKEATSEGTTSLRTAIRYGGLAACATGASIFAGTLLPEVAGFAIGGTVVGVAARATAQLALHYAGQAAIAYAIQKGVEGATRLMGRSKEQAESDGWTAASLYAAYHFALGRTGIKMPNPKGSKSSFDFTPDPKTDPNKPWESAKEIHEAANKLFKNTTQIKQALIEVAKAAHDKILQQLFLKFPKILPEKKKLAIEAMNEALQTTIDKINSIPEDIEKFKKACDSMTDLNVFIPLTKIDEEKRLVYGIATSEVPDRTNEICDYATTKPLYEKWSGDFHKATDGKSMGNLRSMHGNVAAGKVTSVAFNDEAKQIEICAKVVDDNEWKKVLEGVYTGFSQGGAYEKRWKDEGTEYTRYTANPSEISLVDLPCLPSATFKVIKADGMEVEKSFVSVEEQNVNEPEEEFETKIISKRDGSAHNSIEQLKAHHIKLEAEELAKQEASAALELVGSLSKTFGETTETAEATEVEKLEASVEELAKVGARNSKTDKERIQAVHDHACELGACCKNNDSDNDGDTSSDTDMDGKAAEITDLRKRADELEIVKEQLAKANALVAAKEAIITDQMLPLLQKMQKSIEALEAQPTPLPWQVGTKVISKNGDTGVAAGSTDNVPSLEELMSKMTQEEKQVFLMKMAHQFPQR